MKLTDILKHLPFGRAGRWNFNLAVHRPNRQVIATDGKVAMAVFAEEDPSGSSLDYVDERGKCHPHASCKWLLHYDSMFPANRPLDWDWVDLEAIIRTLRRMRTLGATQVRIGSTRSVIATDSNRKTETMIVDIEAFNWHDSANSTVMRATIATEKHP